MTIAEEAHKKIAQEREKLLTKARAEVDAEWDKKIEKSEAQAAMDRQFHEDHMAAVRRNAAVDRTLDRLVGPIKKRGRPKGSKNKPKLVTPNQIGHIPDNDLIIPRRG